MPPIMNHFLRLGFFVGTVSFGVLCELLDVCTESSSEAGSVLFGAAVIMTLKDTSNRRQESVSDRVLYVDIHKEPRPKTQEI